MIPFILAAGVFLAAGFIQGLTGFGAGLLALPLLCLFINIKLAVPLCALNGIILTGYMAYRLRNNLNIKKVIPLFIGCLPGLILGGLLLQYVNPRHIKILLGIILISYSLYNLMLRPKPINLATFWAYPAGFLTGALSVLTSAGGPPAIIYATLTSGEKDIIKATLAGFFFLNTVFTVAVQAISGITTLQTLLYFAITSPFIYLGSVIGSGVSDKINRETYLRIIYLFLIIMGILMLAE